jgi:hypothetical protein
LSPVSKNDAQEFFRTIGRKGVRVFVSQAEIDPKLITELRTVLARLELVSHVSAVNYESSGRDACESIGGKCPPGGIRRADDKEHDYPQKSVEHFRRRIVRATSSRVLEAILTDARRALEAARRQPAPDKKTEPKVGDPGWKRYVAESDEKANELAARFGYSRAYIEEVRRKYRDVEAA